MDLRTNGIAMRVAMIAVVTFGLATAGNAQRPAVRRTTTTAADRKAAAADERAKGLVLGVYTLAAPGISISGDMDGAIRTAMGPGAGVSIGYGFNRRWSGFAALDVVKQGASASDYEGNWGLTHFEVGARANLPTASQQNVPYVMGSIGRRALAARVVDQFDDSEYDISLSGMMFGLGGGLQRVMSPTLMLDGGVELGFGRFGTYDWDGEQGSFAPNGSTSIRFRVGVQWRPGQSRTT